MKKSSIRKFCGFKIFLVYHVGKQLVRNKARHRVISVEPRLIVFICSLVEIPDNASDEM